MKVPKTANMPRLIPYEIWHEQNKDELNVLIEEIFKSINKTTMPKMFGIEHAYSEELYDSMLQFIYENSSSSLRKS